MGPARFRLAAERGAEPAQPVLVELEVLAVLQFEFSIMVPTICLYLLVERV